MLYDKAFKYVICGDPPFKKGSKLRMVKVGELAIKQMLYKLVHLIDLFMSFIYFAWVSICVHNVMFAMCVDGLDVKCSPQKNHLEGIQSLFVEKSTTNFMYNFAQLQV